MPPGIVATILVPHGPRKPSLASQPCQASPVQCDQSRGPLRILLRPLK